MRLDTRPVKQLLADPSKEGLHALCLPIHIPVAELWANSWAEEAARQARAKNEIETQPKTLTTAALPGSFEL